jgi:hypothetical protein
MTLLKHERKFAHARLLQITSVRNRTYDERLSTVCPPYGAHDPPDCMVNIMKELVRIHVASSHVIGPEEERV